MGDGTQFDFDRLRWWRFIDRNAYTNPDTNPDANPDTNPDTNPDANADANADADSRSYADRSRMSDW